MKRFGLAVIAALTLALPSVAAGGEPYHLLFTPEDLPRFRERIEGELGKHYAERIVHRHANCLDAAIAYLLYRAPERLDRAKKMMREQIDICLQPLNGAELASRHYRMPQYLAISYDILRSLDAMTPEEAESWKKDLLAIAEWNMEKNPEIKSGIVNRNTDRYVTVGMIGLLFPNTPEGKKYIEHARYWLDWQLKNGLMTDGSWPETPRYIQVALGRMLIFGRALDLHDGKKNFLARKEFVSFAKRYLEIATPPDVFNDNLRGTPGTGDAYWDFSPIEGSYALAAWLAPVVRPYDEELAGNLMWMWEKSGKPLQSGTYGIPYGLVHSDWTIKPVKPKLKTVFQNVIGNFVIRENFDTPRENYALVHLPSRYFTHRHQDFGGLSVYYHNTPISLDSGASDYGQPEHAAWFKAPFSHNVGVFVESSGKFVPYPGAVRKADSFVDNKYFAGIRTDITKEYSRAIAYLKEPFGIYLVCDLPRSAKNLDMVENIHLMSKKSTVSGNAVSAECFNDKKADILVLSPENAGLKKAGDGLFQRTLDRRTKKFVTVGKFPSPTQEHFQFTVPSGKVALYAFRPGEADAPGLSGGPVPTTARDISLFRLKYDKSSFLVAVNRSFRERRADLPARKSLFDFSTGKTLYPRNGKAYDNLAGNSMKVYSEQ